MCVSVFQEGCVCVRVFQRGPLGACVCFTEGIVCVRVCVHVSYRLFQISDP